MKLIDKLTTWYATRDASLRAFLLLAALLVGGLLLAFYLRH